MTTDTSGGMDGNLSGGGSGDADTGGGGGMDGVMNGDGTADLRGVRVIAVEQAVAAPSAPGISPTWAPR